MIYSIHIIKEKQDRIKQCNIKINSKINIIILSKMSDREKLVRMATDYEYFKYAINNYYVIFPLEIITLEQAFIENKIVTISRYNATLFENLKWSSKCGKLGFVKLFCNSNFSKEQKNTIMYYAGLSNNIEVVNTLLPCLFSLSTVYEREVGLSFAAVGFTEKGSIDLVKRVTGKLKNLVDPYKIIETAFRFNHPSIAYYIFKKYNYFPNIIEYRNLYFWSSFNNKSFNNKSFNDGLDDVLNKINVPLYLETLYSEEKEIGKKIGKLIKLDKEHEIEKELKYIDTKLALYLLEKVSSFGNSKVLSYLLYLFPNIEINQLILNAIRFFNKDIIVYLLKIKIDEYDFVRGIISESKPFVLIWYINNQKYTLKAIDSLIRLARDNGEYEIAYILQQ